MRTRVLSESELRAFWAAAGEMAYPWGPYFRLLLLTMQRRTELASGRRQEIDLERALWTIPAARMKGDAPHVVPLAPLAHSIFASLPTFTKGTCIFSTTFGAKPISGFSKAKRVLEGLMLAELRKSRGGAATLEPWGLHDLRRTGRTALSALPVAEVVRELVIAHAKPGLHKVYDQHAYVDEKRQALALWETRLLGIVEAA
jgi:integrase